MTEHRHRRGHRGPRPGSGGRGSPGSYGGRRLGLGTPRGRSKSAAKAPESPGRRARGRDERGADGSRLGDRRSSRSRTCLSDEMLTVAEARPGGKLVLSPIVAMEMRGTGSSTPSLASGSAAERVASVLGTRVAGAFHNVPAARVCRGGQGAGLRRPGHGRVRGRSSRRRPRWSRASADFARSAGDRSGHAGMVERIDATLLNVGKLNKMRSPSLKVV